MKQNSIKKNAIYNVIRSLSSVLFPFITFYYASRVVGTNNIGKVNYGLSIVSYFSLIAVFGISAYAIRECASIRDSRPDMERKVSELFSFNLLTTIIAMALLGVSILIIPKLHPYRVLILIQSLSIVFTTIGLDWVNVVYDDYRYITIRSIFISALNLIVLFMLVRSPEDYYIYAFLTVLSTIVISIVNFVYIRRYVTPRIVLKFDLKKYVRELMPFFVNEASVVIYVSSDATILGAMKGDYHVGIYSAAVKIYTIVKSIFIAIFSVTLPRLSKHVHSGEKQEFKRILSGTTSVFILLAVPSVTGMMLYARQIVLFVCGDEYLPAVNALRLLSIALLFAVFGGIVTRCINIPFGYERMNSIATTTAALENIAFNLILIPKWGVEAAAFTTVLAELTVLIMGVWYLGKKRDETDLGIRDTVVLKDVRDALIGMIPLIVIYAAVSRLIDNELIRLFTGVIITCICYAGVLLLMRNETFTGMIRRRRTNG